MRPPRILLDTSAYSHMRRGGAEVLEWVAAAETVLLSTTVLGELQAGFRLGSRYRENSAVLAEFLAEPFVRVQDITSSVSLRYGQLFAALRRAGTPIPVNDIWIAASALEAGAHLVTFDADFEAVESLDCTVLRST